MELYIHKIIFTAVFLLFTSPLIAQSYYTPSEKIRPGSVGAYVGLIELNVNYERNIIQGPKSYSNFRIGGGYWTNLQVEGNYINAAFVHLTGIHNSHLELNLGVRYLFDKDKKRNLVLPELYVGYRFEQVNGQWYFRSGLSFPSLLNLGLGFKL